MVDSVPTWVDGSGGGTPLDAAHLNQVSVAIRDLQAATEVVYAAGNSGSALTINWVNGLAQTITLTANCTFTLTGAVSGQECSLELVLTQDATGSRTVTWPGSVTWPGGSAPTLSTAANAVDRVWLSTYDGGTTWYGWLVGSGGSGGTLVAAQIYKSAVEQAVNTGTEVVLDAVDFAVGGMDTSTANAIIVPESGDYVAYLRANISGGNVGERSIYVSVNGTSKGQYSPPDTNAQFYANASVLLSLTAGDVVKMFTWCAGGADATLWNGLFKTALGLVKIGGGDGSGSVTFGTTAGTAAEGDDSRIVGAAQKSANLSDLASASTARTNLGLAAIAASGSASDLSTGTVATARLGSGTANSSTFLRGDNTWAVPSGGGSVSDRTVYAEAPPGGLTAVSSGASASANATALIAMLSYVDTTWGSGRVVLPAGVSIPCGPLGTVPAGVQIWALQGSTLDFSSLTGTDTALSVNDADFTPLVGVKMVGPGQGSTVTALNVSGTGMTFDGLNIRNFGTIVNLANSNTYINRFVGFAFGQAGLIIDQNLSPASGVTNSGERTVFAEGTFFNSTRIMDVESNQGGLFITNCSLDYSADYGLINDSHVLFTGCHLETNFSSTGAAYMFNPGYQTRLAFANCNFILSAVGGEGLRFIINPGSGPSVYTKGRVVWDNCLAFFVDSSHNGQQRFSEEFLYAQAGTTTTTFETPFVSNWSPITAQPGVNSGDAQTQATATVSMGFSSGAPTGSVTVTTPAAVTAGTSLPIAIKF